jgi:hypothetical protein
MDDRHRSLHIGAVPTSGVFEMPALTHAKDASMNPGHGGLRDPAPAWRGLAPERHFVCAQGKDLRHLFEVFRAKEQEPWRGGLRPRPADMLHRFRSAHESSSRLHCLATIDPQSSSMRS